MIRLSAVVLNLREVDYSFNIIKHNFAINSNAMTSINNNCKTKNSTKPVALLIGPATRSSGSITAICFKHRPNTLFIGEATADGYSAGNEYFHFSEGIQLNLSTQFNRDRVGNVYKNSVHPDLLIKGGDHFDELTKDKKIKAAINWLKKKYKF